MKNYLPIVLLSVLLSLFSTESYALKILIKKCNKCGSERVTKAGDWLTIHSCRGSGGVVCHINKINPNGGGIEIDLENEILESDFIEASLLRNIQEAVSRGKLEGKLIYDANNLNQHELMAAWTQAERLLRVAENTPESVENMASKMNNKYHYAVWKIEDNGNFVLIVD